MEMTVHRKPERLDSLLEECLREAGNDMAERSLAVTHQVGGEIPDYPLDRGLIKEAVRCLLTKAIRATRDSGRLRVTLKSNQNAVMLAVKAPGQGLTDVQREILFTGDPDPGTLARVRSIVSAHGGVTWANSMPGKGITYYLSLPVKRTGITTD